MYVHEGFVAVLLFFVLLFSSDIFCGMESLQYPFTTVIPNLGVWVPPQADSLGDQSLDGAGSSGLVLCVSNSIASNRH